MTEPYIWTRFGYVPITDPKPEHIDPRDIAWALSHLVRFTGHASRPYTVAQHSIACAIEANERGCGADVVLAALLHDAAEAYLGDVSTPLKDLLPEYSILEASFNSAISAAFGHVDLQSDAVRDIDRSLLSFEAAYYMGREIGPTGNSVSVLSKRYAMAEIPSERLQMQMTYLMLDPTDLDVVEMA